MSITGFEDLVIYEEPTPPEHRTAADVDLWRTYHPPATSAPAVKRPPTGTTTPEPSFFESWVTQPLGKLGAWFGNLATAPIRAAKTAGLWLGGGLLILLVVGLVVLVFATRLARAVEA